MVPICHGWFSWLSMDSRFWPIFISGYNGVKKNNINGNLGDRESGTGGLHPLNPRSKICWVEIRCESWVSPRFSCPKNEPRWLIWNGQNGKKKLVKMKLDFDVPRWVTGFNWNISPATHLGLNFPDPFPKIHHWLRWFSPSPRSLKSSSKPSIRAVKRSCCTSKGSSTPQSICSLLGIEQVR